MKISTVIIDDEPLARSMIEQMLLPRMEFEIIGMCGTGQEAIKMIDKFNPDLVFLDIQLKDMTGFDVLEHISVKFPLVIFATAYDTFSLKAFDYFAFDYLLKPFNEDRFYKSLNRVIENFNALGRGDLQGKIQSLLDYVKPNQENNQPDKSKTLPIPLKNKTIFIKLTDIYYVLASNSYIEIITKEKKYLLRNSITHFLEELPPKQFFRIHRSTIINLEYVTEILNSDYSEIDVRMCDNQKLRVSKSYKKEFLTQIGLRK